MIYNSETIINLIKQTLSKFIGKQITKDLKNEIHYDIFYALDNILHEDTHHLEYSIEYVEEKINIIPNNLYTGLIFKGIFRPYFLIKDRNEYSCKEGKYTYDKEHGFCFKPSFN